MAAAPNLLFVIADQWRADALGCTGRDPVLTPVLDELAGRARVLTDAVSNYPVCSPCRAMLMTGQYPHRNGVPFNVNSATAPEVGLRPETPCWSDVLSDAGYALGYIGKWHLEAPVEDDASYGEGRRNDGKVWDAYTPPAHRHGFDFWYSHGCCDDHARPHYWVRDAAREEVLRIEQWSAEHETDVAVDYLRTAARRYHEQGQPFALVLSYNPPHQPFDHVPERYRMHYQRREPRDLLPSPNVEWGTPAAAEAAEVAPLYYAAITGVDEQLGRLLTTLDDQGLTNDTIVVFTSDHGMQLGSHGLVYKNVPYEESMRVPFLISWPGHIAQGTDDLLLSSPDVAPTLLGLLGQSARRPPQMQGRDLSDQLLVGTTAGGDPDSARPGAALYIGPGQDDLRLDVRGLRTHSHKLIVEAPPGGPLRWQLFDLVVDPYELTDVADDQPDVVASLAELLWHELDRIGDPWPGRRIIQEELAVRRQR